MPATKRKGSPEASTVEEPSKRRTKDSPVTSPLAPASPEQAEDLAAADRLARFAALRARHSSSKSANLKASQSEASRSVNETAALASLSRKHAVASHKLLKADTEANGDDFERKRAWDWTVDESERWDERVAEKEKRKADQKFQDFRQDARKVYERQMRNFAPDLEKYQKEKMEEIEQAVKTGELQLVEMENGEVVAVDKEGRQFGGTKGNVFAQKKDSKESVDRLVKDMQASESHKIKKAKERLKGGDETGDITFITADVGLVVVIHGGSLTLVEQEVQRKAESVLRQIHVRYSREFRKRNSNLMSTKPKSCEYTLQSQS
jgi:pre-mRNA-splicing factor SYF2